MSCSILLDFGSTFTKAVVVDEVHGEIILKDKEPSTVNTDAKIALDNLYKRIIAQIGEKFDSAKKLATSSAAGGLRMIVVGLTHTLSMVAGKNVAFGAGAKIIKTYVGYLSDKDIDEISNSNVEIILFCGGYEGGNTKMLMHNAEFLAQVKKRVPTIYAGNSLVIKEVKTIFYKHNRECFVVNNVIPQVGVVNNAAAESLIRNIFLERITNMKGLDKVKKQIDRIVMPTPAAVLEAGNLLATGTEKEKGIGNLMIVDIGGSTTDIHTFNENFSYESARLVGSPEPYAKRTVEGDLGMRESSESVIAEIGEHIACADLNITSEQLRNSISRRVDNISFLPIDDPLTSEMETEIDRQIAMYACNLAVRRHCGTLEHVNSALYKLLQKGKNINNISTIIGTGGPIINSEFSLKILSQALATPSDIKLGYILPTNAEFLIDENYILYAAGILNTINSSLALNLLKSNLKKIQ